MIENYGSDVSREQFEIIRGDLEKAKKVTKPRKVDLYDVFCAVLYILKTGCQWRNLPKDFPNWKLVYYYFTVWKKPKENGKSPLEEILKKISTKDSNLATEKGYDAGKKFRESSVTLQLIHKVCRMR